MVTNVHTRRLPALATRVRAAIERLDLKRPADLPGSAEFDVRPDGCASVITHTTVVEGGPLAMVRWYTIDRHAHYEWVAEAFERIARECGIEDRPRPRRTAYSRLVRRISRTQQASPLELTAA